jgi:hypothetical protein
MKTWILSAVGLLVLGSSAQAESPPPAPGRTTIACPSFGHTNPPDASGWTTKYFGYPNANVAAEITGGSFVCHDVMNPAVPLAPFVAQSSRPVPADYKCSPSGPGAPPTFSCVSAGRPPLFIPCPVTAVSDTLDDPAWSTRHDAGTALAGVATTTPPTLECTYLAASSFVGANGTEVATASRPVGGLRGCQVGPDGKSFSCALLQVP